MPITVAYLVTARGTFSGAGMSYNITNPLRLARLALAATISLSRDKANINYEWVELEAALANEDVILNVAIEQEVARKRLDRAEAPRQGLTAAEADRANAAEAPRQCLTAIAAEIRPAGTGTCASIASSTTGLDDGEWKSRERAAKCIYAMCRVFPQFHDVYFTPQNLRLVDQALADTLAVSSAAFSFRDQVAGVEATVLKTLLVVCRAHTKHAAYLSQPHNHSLLAHIKTLASSSSPAVAASTSSMAAMRSSTAPTQADTLAKEIIGLVSRSK